MVGDYGGGGWIGMFLQKGGKTGFQCKYFCKLVKYRYVHVHIVYM